MIKINNRIIQILSRNIGTKFFLILCFATTINFSSCDEASVVGLDVQPTTDLLNLDYTDTLTLVTQTVKEDSLKTDESVIINQVGLLGKYIDPNFGPTSSSIYTSLKLSSTITNNQFGINPTIDSIVLALVYDTTIYGKKDRKAQTVNVYQLTQNIPIESEYYSNNTVSRNSYPLANKVFIPKPNDSVTVTGKKEKPQLRIRLDNNFGQTILNNQATGNLKDNNSLQNFIKGFYITTEDNSNLTSPGDGNIMHFKMADAQTKLTIYYQNSLGDSLVYDFGFSGVSRFLNFKHDYQGANVDATLKSQLTSPTFNQNNVVYVQSLAGVKTKVKMPYLENLNNYGAVAINKAELIIKLETSPTYNLDTYAAPKALVLFGINDDGTHYILPDAFEGSNYYGGTYDNTTKEYRYNIARYIQQILNGKKSNNGIYILASSGSIFANRVVLGGGGSGPYQMKLNITYTKLH